MAAQKELACSPVPRAPGGRIVLAVDVTAWSETHAKPGIARRWASVWNSLRPATTTPTSCHPLPVNYEPGATR
jgi:hypothetical protein